MNISIDGIKNQLQVMYQSSKEQVGHFLNYTVRVLNRSLELVRQDTRLAIPTIIVANILFFETAVLVAKIAMKIIDSLFDLHGKQEDYAIYGAWAAVLSSIVAMNILLYRGLKLPLSPLATAAISTATFVSYFYFRVLR